MHIAHIAAFCTQGGMHPAQAMVYALTHIIYRLTGQEHVVVGDVYPSNKRVVVAPKGIEANQYTVYIHVFHGGHIITPELEQQIGVEFTSQFRDWQVLLTWETTPRWYANGEEV